MHADRMTLHHAGTVVIIYNKTRHSISFGINQAVTIGPGIIYESKRLPEIIRALNFFTPEILRGFHLRKRKNPYGYARILVMPYAEKFVFIIIHFHHITILRFLFIFYFLDGA